MYIKRSLMSPVLFQDDIRHDLRKIKDAKFSDTVDDAMQMITGKLTRTHYMYVL